MSRGHVHIGANRQGRDFLLGDLHGMYDALVAALAARAFDPARDRVISVGDLVDRGPDSERCLALLEEPWFFAVRGNHEEMMIAALLEGRGRAPWYLNGGAWIDDTDEAAVAARLSALLERLPLALTLALPDGGRAGVCHAEYPRRDWAQVEEAIADPGDRFRMLWGREILSRNLARAVAGVAFTVHGHTPLARPLRLGNALFIDTGLVYGGPVPLFTLDELLAIGDASQSPAMASLKR